MAKALGTDLSIAYACVAVCQNEKVEIIAYEPGNRATPSHVAFTDGGRLFRSPVKKTYI